MVERAGGTIDNGAVQALGEMQNAGDGVFRHGQCAADAARGRDRHSAAPEIAPAQIAGAGGPLMKPFQPWRPGPQIERKWPAAENYLSFGEKSVAFIAGSRARGAGTEI